MTDALRVRALTRRFGGLVAVDSVDLAVGEGTITALIGPNGAGKTTLFNCATGLLDPDEGTIELGSLDLTRLGPAARANAGLGRTFQQLEIFAGMTVRENLQVAAEAATPARIWWDILRFRDREEPDITARVDHVLAQVGLLEVAEQQAGDLPTGTLRIVELGRALCSDPRVLLLDEPGSGLDTAETEGLKILLRELAVSGLSVLLVEHDVRMVLDVSDYIYVLDFGRLIAEGPPRDIAENEAVQAAYLGVEEDAGAAAP